MIAPSSDWERREHYTKTIRQNNEVNKETMIRCDRIAKPSLIEASALQQQSIKSNFQVDKTNADFSLQTGSLKGERWVEVCVELRRSYRKAIRPSLLSTVVPRAPQGDSGSDDEIEPGSKRLSPYQGISPATQRDYSRPVITDPLSKTSHQTRP